MIAPYVILVVVILISAVSFLAPGIGGERAGADGRRLFTFVSFFLAALIMGLRSTSVGTDTENYAFIYGEMVNQSLGNILMQKTGFSADPIYLAIMKLFSIVGVDYFGFQLFTSFLFCFGMRRFILKSTTNTLLCTIIFFGMNLYLSAFNITRQLLATMFLANAWTEATDGKRLKSVLLVAVAALFHKTAVIFLVVLLLYAMKERRLLVRVVAPIAIVFVLINYEVILQVVSALGLYRNYLWNAKVKLSAGWIRVVWLIIVMLSVYVLANKKFTVTQSIFATCSLIFVCCSAIGFEFNYFDRLGYYFLPFVILLFDAIAGTQKRGSPTSIVFQLSTTVCFICYFILSCSSQQFLYSSFLA